MVCGIDPLRGYHVVSVAKTLDRGPGAGIMRDRIPAVREMRSSCECLKVGVERKAVRELYGDIMEDR